MGSDPNDSRCIGLDPAKTALALLHFQRDICEAGGIAVGTGTDEADVLARFSTAIECTATLAAGARQSGIPVLYSAFGRPANGALANRFGPLYRWITELGRCVEGEAGYAMVASLEPEDGDIVTRSPGVSAFAASTFGAELNRLGIRTVLLTGITTHWAVESTTREAADRGFDCIVVTDCVASADQAFQDQALERLGSIARLTDSRALLNELSSTRRLGSE